MMKRHASTSSKRQCSVSRLLAVLLLATTAAAAASTTGAFVSGGEGEKGQSSRVLIRNDEDDNPIITMPLVPHRVQKARRRLERGSSSAGDGSDSMTSVKKKQQEEELRSHYRRFRHRHLQNADEANFHPEQIAELYQGYGTHYVDLWCGTPPQRQTVIVDTGSGVTAFPCSGCGTDCGVPKYHASPLFVEHDSSSFKKLSCQECLRGACRKYGEEECHIGMSYQEGSSWSAYEAVDRCYVGGPHAGATADDGGLDAMDPFHAPSFAFDMKFGCQTHLTGLFITQLADGIMGMDNAEAAYWQQMYDRKVIKRKAFSLCFSRHDSVDRSGTESGAMTMGGTDTRLHKSPMVYSSTGGGGSSGFYAITLRNIYLRKASGGTSAQTSNPDVQPVPLGFTDISTVIRSQVIVDSGTTDTYFTRSLAPYFNKVWKDMTGTDYGNKKMTLTDAELDAMPTIIFQLAGDSEMNPGILDAAKNSGQQSVIGLTNLVDPTNAHDILIAMPARHYMEFDDDDETWTPRFYVDESGSGGVLGANMMMGHDVLFDVQNNRIGWAEADCDYTALMQHYSSGWDDGSHTPPAAPAGGDNNGGDGDNSTPEGGDDGGAVDDYVEPNDDMTGETDDRTPVTNDDTPDQPTSQQGLPKTKDEPTLPDSQFCSSLTCQGGVIAIVLIVVIVVAVRLLRSSSGGAYEVADAGLELKSGSISNASSDDDYETSNGNGTQYRDRPANGNGALPNIS